MRYKEKQQLYIIHLGSNNCRGYLNYDLVDDMIYLNVMRFYSRWLSIKTYYVSIALGHVKNFHILTLFTSAASTPQFH